jgi:RNA polymerase sigma factor FliA
VVPPRDAPEVLERFHANLDLVDVIARQVGREMGRSIELDDLRALGHQGLLEAARRYDASRGVAFSRFANYRVRGAMFDGIRKSAPLPRRAHARLRALEAALAVAETHAEDATSAGAGAVLADPSAADAVLGERLSDMATAMAAGLVAHPALGEEGEPSAVEPGLSPEEAVAEAELRAIFAKALEALPHEERTLIDRHYFMGQRFDEVAASLHLSKSWASRLHTRAVALLTKRLRVLAR